MKWIESKVQSIILIAIILGVLGLMTACASTPTSAPSATAATPPTAAIPTTPPPTPTPTTPPSTSIISPGVSASPSPSVTAPVSPSASVAATSPSSTAATFQSLAASGKTIYSGPGVCSTCHGDNGQGTNLCPVVMWGQGATLGTYKGTTLFTDAQGMLSFISAKMPLTAPGSLTHQQYIELLAYILVQANKVSPSTPFNESQLGSITLK